MRTPEDLVKLLTEKGWHIVTMESCTGGALANAITNIPGSSAVLMDSFVTYSNEAKIKLGVPAELIEEHTVYSTEVAQVMAEQAVANSVAGPDKTIGVGITGSLTREDPNNPNSQPGKVYFAICVSGAADQQVTLCYELNVEATDREQGKAEIISGVLNDSVVWDLIR